MLPHWQEAIARGSLGVRSKCETCMEKDSEQTRQQLGCGFAPPLPDRLSLARSYENPAGYKGASRKLPDGRMVNGPTVCPGYTTSLPEVIEVARARLHWKNGGPAAIGITDWQDNPLTIGIEILEGACNAAERWASDNPVKK